MIRLLRFKWNRLVAPVVCMHKVRVYLKGGDEIVVYCDKFKFQVHGGDVVKYEIRGASSTTNPLHIDPAQIAAIIQER